MFEYQIVVWHKSRVVFKTQWHVGQEEARNTAWLLASKFGEDYAITVSERREEFKSTPWEQFGLDVTHAHAA